MSLIRKVAWLHIVDRALLCARSEGRAIFYVPGGKPEPGESDEAALIREIAEELGVAIDPASITPFARFSAPANGRQDMIVTMDTYRAAGSGEPRASSEIAELRWVRAQDTLPVSAATRLIPDRLKDDDAID